MKIWNTDMERKNGKKGKGRRRVEMCSIMEGRVMGTTVMEEMELKDRTNPHGRPVTMEENCGAFWLDMEGMEERVLGTAEMQ